MLYTIENLKCGYNGTGVVLQVPSLQLRAGQTIVVLGKSGYGKSTFLETLALMNNTLLEGSILFNPPSLNGGGPVEMAGMWGEPGSHERLAALRCRHFSFIFQQTNLMPNFSVYENIYITRMMQGFQPENCHKAARDILERIGMSGIDSKRKVTELSGGQRQRVAFARAVVSSFDVLFGDEPTGNLDEVNSLELLQLLNGYIKDNLNSHPKTAIIVSHSIDLAVRFADTIVVISYETGNGHGQILQDNVFHRDEAGGGTNWENRGASLTGEVLKGRLRELFTEN
jgi:ABC-type lipoprotein export system ATPase subunit